MSVVVSTHLLLGTSWPCGSVGATYLSQEYASYRRQGATGRPEMAHSSLLLPFQSPGNKLNRPRKPQASRAVQATGVCSKTALLGVTAPAYQAEQTTSLKSEVDAASDAVSSPIPRSNAHTQLREHEATCSPGRLTATTQTKSRSERKSAN